MSHTEGLLRRFRPANLYDARFYGTNNSIGNAAPHRTVFRRLTLMVEVGHLHTHHAENWKATLLSSNHFLYSLFLLRAVNEARETEPDFDQRMP